MPSDGGGGVFEGEERLKNRLETEERLRSMSLRQVCIHPFRVRHKVTQYLGPQKMRSLT